MTATSTEYTFSTSVRASLSRREQVAAMAIHQADVLLRLLDADPEPAPRSGAEGEGGAAR